MSVNAEETLFEGFLQKRKDNLRMRWVTYWFRLQGSMLSFYTKKNERASYLKGQYSIATVQAVQEVQRAERKRFLLLITMTNGKTKLLSAKTAALRQQWVENLRKAMDLSSNSAPTDTHLDLCHQLAGTSSSSPQSSLSDARLGSQPLCVQTDPETHEAEAAAQDSTYECLRGAQGCLPVHSGTHQPEEDYDVLPCRNSADVCEEEEGVYDVPQAYRSPAGCQVSTESDYDVPSALLRKMSVHPSGEQPEEEVYWRI